MLNQVKRPCIQIVLMLLICSPALWGQVITMKSIQAEGEISLSIATHSENSIVTIDWGDGVQNNYTFGAVESECKGPATQKTITITGDVAKLNCMASKLVEIDVSKYPKLWVLQAAYNNIASLDLSENVELANLEVFGNMLKTLDLRTCSKLERLVCSGNYLSALNLETCKELKYLDCTRMGRMTKLDLSHNSKLTNLLINECSISELKLPREGTPLVEFWCHQNQLTTLNLLPYTSLEEVNCSDNPLTSLVINAPKMERLLAMNTLLEDFSFVAQMPELTYLMLTGNKHLASIDLTANISLTDLGLSKCSLRKLSLTAQKGLKQLWAEENQLTSIDLSSCSELETVKLKGNQIEQITFPKKSKISTLSLPKNALADISLEGLDQLISLDLGNNFLQGINLANCTKLSILNVASNKIRSLELQHTPELKMLGVVGNGMTAEELDKIYESLPYLEEPSAKVNLYNGTKQDQAARSSTTNLAIARNWKPFVLGDGSWSGCLPIEPLRIAISQYQGNVSISSSGSGQPIQVSLYQADGSLLSVYEMVNSPLSIQLPAPGVYLIHLENQSLGVSQTERILY